MNKFLLVLGGATLAVAIYVILNQDLGIAAPVDGVDEAGNQAGAWGTKQRGFGLGGQLKGKVEQGAGKLTGDSDLQTQGALDQATGAVKDAAGQVAQAVGSAIHDLNK